MTGETYCEPCKKRNRSGGVNQSLVFFGPLQKSLLVF